MSTSGHGHYAPPLNPLLKMMLLGFLLSGCGEARSPTGRNVSLVSYQQQVQPILAHRCVPCHGGSMSAGHYVLDFYLEVLGPGTDEVRNAIAGNENSLLLTKLQQSRDPMHWSYLLPTRAEINAGISSEQQRERDYQILRDWVVQDNLAYFNVAVHPPAWLNPEHRNNPDFHGGKLRAIGWNFDECRKCHGQDLRGGRTQHSCQNCHTQGVEGCTTCHGSSSRNGPGAAAPPPDLSWNVSHTLPGVGAHQAHLNPHSTMGMAQCGDCHHVPNLLRDAGHVDNADFHAEIIFSDKARGKERLASLDMKPVYNQENHTCTNVYCHTLNGARQKDWNWIQALTLNCTSCHGYPPAKTITGDTHPDIADCTFCHASAYNSKGDLDITKHINGRVDR